MNRRPSDMPSSRSRGIGVVQELRVEQMRSERRAASFDSHSAERLRYPDVVLNIAGVSAADEYPLCAQRHDGLIVLDLLLSHIFVDRLGDLPTVELCRNGHLDWSLGRDHPALPVSPPECGADRPDVSGERR